MYDANRHKAASSEKLMDLLLNSKGKISFHASTKFWNFWNARILEKIRAENRRTEKDEEYLVHLNLLFEDFLANKLGKNYDGIDFKACDLLL